MRINTQNMFWMNTNTSHGQKTLSQFLPGSARKADAQRMLKQKEIAKKLSDLTRTANTKQVDIGLENSGPAALSSFIVAKEDVPAKAAQMMETYYQAAGSLTDSVTYKEARLKYLQSEYEKLVGNDSGGQAKDSVGNDFGVQAENTAGIDSEGHVKKLQELIKAEYKDTAGVLNYTANLLREGLRNSETVYGREFSEEYKKLLGDIPDKISRIADGLLGAKSVEEAFEHLAAAKEELLGLANELTGRYQEYTGKDLPEYQYKTEADYKGSVESYALLWSWDEVMVDTENVENLSDYGVDINNLGAVLKAVNLIDTKA